MRLGRRTLFFFGVAVVCLLMLVPTPAEFRWLNVAMASLAAFWGVLLGVEETATARRQREDDEDDARNSA